VTTIDGKARGPWTAADVPDQSGRTAVVTGASGGLGLQTAQVLAGRGATVVLACRDLGKAEQAAELIREQAGRDSVAIVHLDLASLASVRQAAGEIRAACPRLDLLINNAAVMAPPYHRTEDGFELTFATNHLGHFALINRLWPAIQRGGGRVVALSSSGHRRSPIRWDDIDFATGYDKWNAYGQAKTANSLFAVELDALAKDAGVRAFAVHPGGIRTPLQRHLTNAEMAAFGWTDEDGNLINDNFKTTEQGAATSVWAATSPQLHGMGGVYCEDCDIAELVPDDDKGMVGVRSYAVDPEQAARLWTLSAELTGVNAFA
jgi:NAD(P)-dependent dehydrogenase (short-subunit alcohol dehydrogenase family)